jgi:hypothetical protein
MNFQSVFSFRNLVLGPGKGFVNLESMVSGKEREMKSASVPKSNSIVMSNCESVRYIYRSSTCTSRVSYLVIRHDHMHRWRDIHKILETRKYARAAIFVSNHTTVTCFWNVYHKDFLKQVCRFITLIKTNSIIH